MWSSKRMCDSALTVGERTRSEQLKEDMKNSPHTPGVGGFVSCLTGFAYNVSGLLPATLSSAGSVLTQQRHSWYFARSW